MDLLSHQTHQGRPNSPVAYVRHRPETTLLYQIVQEYWSEFQAESADYQEAPIISGLFYAKKMTTARINRLALTPDDTFCDYC